MCHIFVLGVIEHKIFYAQLCCKLAGFLDRTVILLVGLEYIPCPVEAERLGKQPVRPLRILFRMLIVRFVPQTGEPHAIRKFQLIAELLRLGRKDIECREHKPLEGNFLPILHFLQDDAAAELRQILLFQRHARHRFQHLLYRIMAVDMEFSLKLPLVHERRDLSDHPNDPQHMIRMPMGHEHVMHTLPVRSRKLHLPQDSIPPAGIRQKDLPILQPHKETGIIAMRHHRVPRPQHHKLSHFCILQFLMYRNHHT